jgi:kumamolisin
MPRTASPKVPAGYRRLAGSERRAQPGATRIGPAPAEERIEVTVILRRRPDGPEVPGHHEYLTPPSQRPRLAADEFAERYGFDPADVERLTEFAEQQGLEVTGAHPARRAVYLAGTVEQFEQAFAVSLGRYQYERETRSRDGRREPISETVTYRGREGQLAVPRALADAIVGVFGLDDRSVTHRNLADPPSTGTITLPEVRDLYGFPANQAAGQTIAIFSEGGYLSSDIDANFGGNPPAVTDISIDASNGGFADPETTQDIFIAAAVAPGADVAVYFNGGGQKGWVDTIGRIVHPDPGDPVCSVMSSSFYILNGDDAGLASGVTAALIDAVSEAFADAAIQGVTLCIASGDTGTESKIGDGSAHVQYPGSDPWVLSCGGTTIGDVTAAGFDEWVWADQFSFGGSPLISGATGGGVSAIFELPSYQVDAGVPVSLNDGHRGRGVPDVAANSSPNSGYPIILDGSLSDWPANGTSASAPLWAGLIAVINAALGENVGFVNPALYALGSSAFRDITAQPGAADNGLFGTPGYPVTAGWDACTGWGAPQGNALLTGLHHFYGPAIAVSPEDGLAFGTVCSGPRYLSLTVANVGSTDLMLLDVARIAGSADFTVLPLPGTPLALAPGAEITFTVRYEPTGAPGSSETGVIRITSDDPLRPEVDLKATATIGSGSLRTVIADSGDFGRCCVGSFVDRPLTLVNDGPCTLTITGLASDSGDFVVHGVAAYPLKLAAGTSLAMPIRFRPESLGAHLAQLTVDSDDPSGAKPVQVSGRSPGGRLTVSGSGLFDGVPACEHAEKTVWVANTGECPLHVSHVGFRHPAEPWHLVNNPFPATLAAGAMLPVVIRYHAIERYARLRELEIVSDDPDTPVREIEVLAHTVWPCGCEERPQCGCCEPPRCCDDDGRRHHG